MSGYDFSGIWWHVWSAVVIALRAIGVVLLCRLNGLMKGWEVIVTAVFAIILIGFACEDVRHIRNPEIEMVEGVLVKEYSRRRRGPFTWEYIVEDSIGRKTSCFLDSFTCKKMLPEGFFKGDRYRVYYEDNTDIIVKIEFLE